MEVCWAILRFFGYDNDLMIREELWNDKSFTNLEDARSIELKKGAYKFIEDMYNSEKNQDGSFTEDSIRRVFSTSPFE
jgi:hypothetical protein